MVTNPEFLYTNVNLAEVFAAGGRLDANTFNIEAKIAREKIERSTCTKLPLSGNEGLSVCFHRPRFKRPYVNRNGEPFYQPAQINEVNPSPARYLAFKGSSEYDALRVQKGQILMTCSGTIGDVSLVGNSLHEAVFSHDLIRIAVKDESMTGYIYSFLKSEVGKLLVTTSNYGAVIQHVEPSHLAEINIPILGKEIIKECQSLINKYRSLLDQSNKLYMEAINSFTDELKLPALDELSYKKSKNNIFSINSNACFDRFEASYHNLAAVEIEECLKKSSGGVTSLLKSGLCSNIRRPNQFKRVYVEAGAGIPFFTGKSIGELFPMDVKYLSYTQHEEKIKELLLSENQILITRSGTIGNVALVPKHWAGMAITDDIIIIDFKSKLHAGFVSAWLSSGHGQELLKRMAYGAVVQHIESKHVERILIPCVENDFANGVASKMLEVNKLRSKAYDCETMAVKLVEDSLLSI